jgi:hypothetical protein
LRTDYTDAAGQLNDASTGFQVPRRLNGSYERSPCCWETRLNWRPNSQGRPQLFDSSSSMNWWLEGMPANAGVSLSRFFGVVVIQASL